MLSANKLYNALQEPGPLSSLSLTSSHWFPHPYASILSPSCHRSFSGNRLPVFNIAATSFASVTDSHSVTSCGLDFCFRHSSPNCPWKWRKEPEIFSLMGRKCYIIEWCKGLHCFWGTVLSAACLEGQEQRANCVRDQTSFRTGWFNYWRMYGGHIVSSN